MSLQSINFFLLSVVVVAVVVTQLCPTLCDPMGCKLPGSSVHGILQARILERIAIPFSRGSSGPRDCTLLSCIAGRFFTVWATYFLYYNFFFTIMIIHIKLDKWRNSLCIWVTFYCSFYIIINKIILLHRWGAYQKWCILMSKTLDVSLHSR